MPDLFTIGRAARESGLTPDTIRYYERLRLLGRPPRSSGGYRLYDRSALERLRTIRHARSIGFSLEDISLLFTERAGRAECSRVRDTIGAKIEHLDRQIAQMRHFRDQLDSFRARCERALTRGARRCPLFDADDRD